MKNFNKSKDFGDRRGGGDFGRRKSGGRDFNRGGGRDFGGRDERPEMHQTICSECGRSCEVPFRPSGDKPVFCSDCFKSKGRSDSRRPERDFKNSSFGEKRMFEAVCANCGDACEVPFRPTGDKPVLCSDCFSASGGSVAKNADRPKEQNKTKEQFEILNSKLDKILKIISPAVSTAVVFEKETTKPEEIIKNEKETKKTNKKKDIKKKAKEKKKA